MYATISYILASKTALLTHSKVVNLGSNNHRSKKCGCVARVGD